MNARNFESSGADKKRTEEDALGCKDMPADALYGIHTVRAMENFPLSGQVVHHELWHAYGTVKLACATVNHALGAWKDAPQIADAIMKACSEAATGFLDNALCVDALQGGAGTSTNMNMSEVIANRALQIAGCAPGSYETISPLDDINRHQSTNDTFPTALKLAAITMLRKLEAVVVALQEAFQEKERAFSHVVKVARTEMQDAVLMTLGREMGAYAEALSRDRWRIYKCEERLRVVNLGGTAIGTGLGAPRDYIFRVVDTLRDLTGIGFARAENLIDATQNADVFVEVSGMLKTLAASLVKICGDVRLLASGPEAGIGEITLTALQAGSSIMPHKVNPVIPEAVTQACIRVIGHDMQITMAAAAGNLELNQFMPLIADSLLHSIELLTNACTILTTKCVVSIGANEAKCSSNCEGSTAIATALVGVIGYEMAGKMVQLSKDRNCTIREAVIESKLLTKEQFDELVTPEAVMRLGSGSTGGKK